MKLFYSNGAKVVFGDLDTALAEEVVKATSSNSVHFIQCDVRNYADELALFKAALERYGKVDYAIANAGVFEKANYFDPQDGLEGMEKEPNLTVVDVNLKGVLYFARIACTYLSHGQDRDAPSDKCMVLTSSVTGFKETPGIPVYQSSKHGVLGLLRALRLYLPKTFPGVRINAVCPSMTFTGMTVGLEDGWMKDGLPVNQPGDIAKVLAGLCVSGPGRAAMKYDVTWQETTGKGRNAGGTNWEDQSKGVSGRAIYVAGGQGWDVEEGLDRTEHLWMGEDPSTTLIKIQAAMAAGR